MSSRNPIRLSLLLLPWLAFACGDTGGSDADQDQGTDAADHTASTSDPGGDASGSDEPEASTGPAATCDTPLTQWEQMMLDAHNEWRASVEPAAADMHRLYWDTEIAQNAAAWVSSCDPDWPHSPDESRAGVGGYEALGENLSYCAGTGCTALPDVTDGSGLGDGIGWWEERHDYDWDTNSESGITSHYTQMVSSNVYAIGCATQRCGSPGPFGWNGDWWWTICQYGPRGQGYWVDSKPYDAGEGGLVDLSSSVGDAHPGLCGP